MLLAILQVRYSSTRLPGKALKHILGKPLLALQIERVQRSSQIDSLVVATSVDPADDAIQQLCDNLDISCFRGSLENVLDRFYQVAILYKPNHIVRLTGDCSLIDPEVVDQCIAFYLQGDFDYASNTIEPSFPDGLDVEIFKFSALEKAWQNAKYPSEKEHVTSFIYKNPSQFNIGNYKTKQDLSGLRWTVDEPEDFQLVTQIYEHLYPSNPEFTTQDVLQLLEERPQLIRINEKFARNEGLQKSLREDQEWLGGNAMQ